jgi:uncharacterized protein
MNDALEDKLRMNRLFDIYGALLTDKQRDYFIRYYQDDYSLSEVAALFDVSRNAVFDQIQKAAAHLVHYESILKLEERRLNRLSLYETLKTADGEDIAALVSELERLE